MLTGGRYVCVCVLLTGAPLLLSELMIDPENKNETRTSSKPSGTWCS